eukprot:GEMP01008050.1.p1 GENE.GEMP01008050.1~~GEMP01008050.1.p1  ORF type:complete len:403 (+),score=63.86 GEMP01008050.1:33-1241(+)
MDIYDDDVLDDATLARALSSAVSAFLQPNDDDGDSDDASKLSDDNPDKLRWSVPALYVDTALKQHNPTVGAPKQRYHDNEACEVNLSKEFYGNQPAANAGTLADLLYRHERYAGSQEDDQNGRYDGEHEEMHSEKGLYSVNAQSTSSVLSASDGSVFRKAHGDYWNNWDSSDWSWFSSGSYNSSCYDWGEGSVTSSLHYQNVRDSIGSSLNYRNSCDTLTLELAQQVQPPDTTVIDQHRIKVDKKKKSRQSAVLEFGPSVTTIMVRNIPNRYTPEELLAEVESRNFARTFNYFYLPMDFANKVNMGYCFINFLTSHQVDPFYREFNGVQLPKYTTSKIIEICPASTQGYVENVTKFLKGAARRIQNQFFRPLIFKTKLEHEWYPIPLTKDNLTIGITEQAIV